MQNLEDLLVALHGAEQRCDGALGDPACIPLPRLRELALDPARRTEAERRHLEVDRCGNCSRARDLVAADLWHPAPAALFRHHFRLDPPDARVVALHLERDACLRCQGLIRWMERTGLRAFADRMRAGVAGAAESLESFLSAVRAPLTPVLVPAPVARQSWATARAESLFCQVELAGGEVEVTLQEEERRAQEELRVEMIFETRSADLAGRAMHFAIVPTGDGEGEGVAGRTEFGPAELEGWVTARASLGPLQPFREAVGEHPVILLYPDDPERGAERPSAKEGS